MPADIVLGLTALGLVVLYIYLVLKLAFFLASLIASPFSKPDDEEIDRYVGSGGPYSGWNFVPITRGDRRVQIIFSIVVLPPLIYVHYRFWDPITNTIAWMFEDVLAPFIIATFYDSAAAFFTPAVSSEAIRHGHNESKMAECLTLTQPEGEWRLINKHK